MKPLRKAFPVLAIVALLTGLIGCSSGGGATAVGKTLYQQLGGADGVTRLANQFGANIKSNPTLNALLDAVAIGNMQSGLTNDIMTASGMKPASATTLESALAGKNLGADGLNAVSNSLTEAGKALNLDASTMSSLSGLLKPLSKSVLGM
jgi:hypothetical protein